MPLVLPVAVTVLLVMVLLLEDSRRMP